ncbi:unannotated protein [freshwater metagenome]|uniref:Unannotated protein n=1 Tax=freshwater metagenome TaxID=449393 RepID=A0A6J5ZCE5_9ZZZZ|nr:SDR family oxidoreductase [Actinomycetota bacterium]MSW24709.1 SDR family oxidoreductase [Actinomycetota bacterium]MSX28927.1 SDR family oxidoreductase [Actinomycetota bacterium]MSX96696.1 SDR family oxidoreductase [Actinomycetota bacterium]MSZ78913.1 SDR family oxidoreductase [Actinomycetota bacterium]
MNRVAVFGSSGALGSTISNDFENLGFDSVRLTSSSSKENLVSTLDENWVEVLTKPGKLDAAVWAQGFNQSDNISEFSIDVFNKHLDANVSYILDTVHKLIAADAFTNRARIVILSSIWQESSKANKLSYMVSKSALKGLVTSLCLDLGHKGISVNAVLPGVTDSPMTHRNLSSEQIAHVVDETPLNILPRIEEVSKTVTWLASTDSSGINGQFITVDNGWTRYRNV